MTAAQTGRRYTAIAAKWDCAIAETGYGVAPVKRAIAACARKEHALDVGCGTGGRIVNEMLGAGFTVTGVDVSEGMLGIARARHCDLTFIHADICEWIPPRQYDLIVAWDSTFHLRLKDQAPVLGKLCGALAPGGVFLFTAGGVNGEVTGEMYGESFYYSSLTDDEYLRVANCAGCSCLYLERDQWPLPHIVALVARP